MRVLRFLAGAALLCAVSSACAGPDTSPPSRSVMLTLGQGASEALPGAGITVTLVEVRAFTSAGCQGGPRGCPDEARVAVSKPGSRREVRLRLAHTSEQHDQGSDQADVFGYHVTLVSVGQDQAALLWERDQDRAPGRKS